MAVNLGTGTAAGGDAAGDTISGFENVTGSANADTLTGNGLGNAILAGDGNDTLAGGLGNDTLTAGDGADTIVFAGARSGYAVAFGSDGLGAFTRVTDTDATNGDEGTDRIYGAETLQFADTTDPTAIRTPGGTRAVEALRIGDPVLTADGHAVPVRWLGRQTVSTRFADPLRVLPVRVLAGALAEGLPERDLLVSPDHALLVDGVLVQAGALVNGSSIRREHAVPEVFTYHHVELANHALMMAEGVPAETFVDNVDRMAFDNWAEHAAQRGAAPIAELDLPRAKSHRQVPMATRRRLEARAAAMLARAAA